MSIQEIVSILTNSGIEPNEATQEVKMLIEHFCNYGAKDIIMGRPLDYERLNVVKEKAILRAKTKQPIQYIIGKAYFMGNFYKVTKDVLIPRDETEIVVLHAIDIIKKNNFSEVLDIGTGSGCIACSISDKNVNVTACDISSKALTIAKENAARLDKGVDFIESNLFLSIPIDKKFDLIISNPPYIPAGTELQEEVKYEPSIALFTSENTGCEFYKKIIEQGKHYLNQGGYIVFELGINESDLVKTYFETNGYTGITVEKDLAGIDRVISAKII
ncbi:peptide chain release factor N(5)-glutamine methyltransferase [bacterium]|nr:peptide chain release factor N(5)-glutamine methyltransferase [bacterium]